MKRDILLRIRLEFVYIIYSKQQNSKGLVTIYHQMLS
jgi:hypothetical protein